MPNRPRIKDMVRKIEAYVAQNRDALPILKECCLINNWDYDDLCKMTKESPALQRSVKKLELQREVNLEKGGIFGTFNKAMISALLEQAGREKADNSRDQALTLLDELLSADRSAAMLVTDESEIGNIAQGDQVAHETE